MSPYDVHTQGPEDPVGPSLSILFPQLWSGEDSASAVPGRGQVLLQSPVLGLWEAHSPTWNFLTLRESKTNTDFRK